MKLNLYTKKTSKAKMGIIHYVEKERFRVDSNLEGKNEAGVASPKSLLKRQKVKLELLPLKVFEGKK